MGMYCIRLAHDFFIERLCQVVFSPDHIYTLTAPEFEGG